MKLEHVGIAVRNLDEVLAIYKVLFDAAPYKMERVEREGVETHFIDAGGTKVELLVSTRDDSPVGRFLDRHGPGLHHLAFAVDDVDEALVRARRAGLRVLSDTPYAGADGKRVCFIHPKDAGGVLVELCSDAPPPRKDVRDTDDV